MGTDWLNRLNRTVPWDKAAYKFHNILYTAAFALHGMYSECIHCIQLHIPFNAVPCTHSALAAQTLQFELTLTPGLS